MENVCRLDFGQTRTILIWAIMLATPLFILFGWWSDRIGRKWIMLAGMLLAVATYRPIYQTMLDISETKGQTTDPALSRVERSVMASDNAEFSLVHVTTFSYFQNGITEKEVRKDTLFNDNRNTSTGVGKTSRELPDSKYWLMVLMVFIQILYVTMVYGPIAAFLVELFPTRIRYTSMSLPYHIGNGVFGGLTPFIALLLTTIHTTDPLVGLWYPIGVAVVCLIIGTLYVSNRIDPNVND
jgi:MFS family permease